MQSENPKLYFLYEKNFITYKTLLECFLKPEYLELTEQEKTNIHDKAVALESKILDINFENIANHLPLDDIYLGGNVAALIIKNRNNIQTNQIHQLKQKCLEFYIESLKQIKYRFPFEDEYRQKLKNLNFLNPNTFLDSNLKRSVPSIAHIGLMFPGLCPTNFTELDREWRTLRNTDLVFQEDQIIEPDEFWRHISKMRKGDSSQMFPLLTQFIQNLLTLPHSSANVERLFSSINLIKTNIRSRLTTDTLTGLLFTKSGLKTNSEPTQEHMQYFNKNMYKFNLPEHDNN